MACKDELYDPVVNYDSGSSDEDLEPSNNNVKLPSGPQSCGNDRINDVFIHNNLRSGGPMMDGERKLKPQEEDGNEVKSKEGAEVSQEGDGKEKGEVSQEGDGKEKGEVSQEGDGKEKGEVSQEGDRKEKEKEIEVPPECWEPCETEEEKKRARKQGVKKCKNHGCHHPNREFVGFLYNSDAYECSEICEGGFCYVCATLPACPEHPTHSQKRPKQKPKKMD